MDPDGHIRRDTGEAPGSSTTANAFSLSAEEARASFARLAEERDALVLDAEGEIWMAEPFSAVPTTFRVRSGERAWWGNCIWDGLAILALLDVDGTVTTTCPDCEAELVVGVRSGTLIEPEEGAVVHFLVPAADWWRDIGYT